MLINEKENQLELEERDVIYALQGYIKAYYFGAQGKSPLRIIFPTVQKIGDVAVEYVPVNSPIAVAIKEDAADASPTTEESEKQADAEEVRVKSLAEQLAELQGTAAPAQPVVATGDHVEPAPPAPEVSKTEETSPAKAALAAAKEAEKPKTKKATKAKKSDAEHPRQAPNPAPKGPLDDSRPRADEARELRQVKKDLAEPGKFVEDEEP